MTPGKRLRQLRLAKGLTQKDLAEPRYTHAYISIIEAGKRQPSQAALGHFAAKLGVDIDELVTGRPHDLVPRLQMRLQDARRVASSGGYTDARKAYMAVAKLARLYGLARLKGEAERGLAICAELGGDPSNAIELYERAEATLAKESADLRTDAIAGKARCLQMIGEVHYAIYLLEKQLETLKQEGLSDPTGLSRLHVSLTAAYFEAGFHLGANSSAKEALRLAAKVTDPEGLACMHMNVARVHLENGRTDQALESLQRAEDLYRQLSFQSEVASAHLARGYVFSRDGKLDLARRELTAARDLFVSNDSSIDEARATNELARIERLRGHTDEAQQLLKESMSLLAGGSHLGVLAWAHRELGILLSDRNPRQAEKALREAIDLFQRVGDGAELGHTYRALGDLKYSLSEPNLACDAYRKGIDALVEA